MTSERTKAMDDLIAQDADLIDSPLVDRLRWVSEWYFVDPVDGTAYASDDPLDAADRIEELEAENERLREALELADAALRGANMNMNVVERKVRAALAGKAEQ